MLPEEQGVVAGHLRIEIAVAVIRVREAARNIELTLRRAEIAGVTGVFVRPTLLAEEITWHLAARAFAFLDVYQESTYWDPSWTTGTGTSTVCDMVHWARAGGTGALLSPASYAAQTTISGEKVPGVGYALGVVITNGWRVQTPSMPGFYSVIGYLPSKDLAIAIVSTEREDSPVQGENSSLGVFRQLVLRYAPDALPAEGFFKGL